MCAKNLSKVKALDILVFIKVTFFCSSTSTHSKLKRRSVRMARLIRSSPPVVCIASMQQISKVRSRFEQQFLKNTKFKLLLKNMIKKSSKKLPASKISLPSTSLLYQTHVPFELEVDFHDSHVASISSPNSIGLGIIAMNN